tara:strand:- start:158 stop:691 length:534 start_codon:yes stop_codon:yes gene_type:complete
MSGKKLLSENTVRRFMQLASIEPLSNKFIAESPAYKGEYDDDKDPMEEALEDEEELELDDADDEMDLDPELGAEDDEMDLDPEMDAEEPGMADMSLTEEEARILIDLGKRLEEALGEEGDLAADDDLDVAPVDDAPVDAEMDAEEEVEDEEEPPMAESLVNEVLKRVTKRIIKEKLR